MRFTHLALVVLLLTGCTGTQTTHGNFITPKQIAQLTPNEMTKDDVLATLGSPSTYGTMNANRWYYMTELQHTKPFEPNRLVTRTLLLLDFDDAGTLVNITQKDQGNSKEVVMDETITPTQGQALGVIDQIIQNVQTFGR
jgi:outer membrane protein assembly factor BamE (lipoprotein component of BamABCDE complex)